MTKLTPSQQKIVNAVAALSEGPGDPVLRKKVMLMSGYAPKNTGFVVALSTLKTKKKCLVFDSDTVTLTELGLSLAEPMDSMEAPSNEEHIEKIRSELKGNKAKLVFDVLVSKDGKKQTRVHVAQAVGYDSPKCSGFAVAISQLASKGFMEYCTNDEGEACLILTDQVYPFGRP